MQKNVEHKALCFLFNYSCQAKEILVILIFAALNKYVYRCTLADINFTWVDRELKIERIKSSSFMSCVFLYFVLITNKILSLPERDSG